MGLFSHVCHGKMALEHISRTSVSGSVLLRGLMLLDMLQGAPPCHLVSDLLAGALFRAFSFRKVCMSLWLVASQP